MQYNGKELIEMTTQKWDGKSRWMLVWDNANSIYVKLIVSFCSINNCWMTDDGYYWHHCADLPYAKSHQEQNIDEMIKTPHQVQTIDEMIKILNAYKEGKTIEHRFRNRDIGDSWGCIDMQNPEWNWGIFEYRVKPDLEAIVHKKFNAKIKSVKKARRMTNRELADLMATGKVEKCYPYNVNGRDLTRVYRTHSYYRNRENSACAKSILIRYIGTNEWVKPLIEE